MVCPSFLGGKECSIKMEALCKTVKNIAWICKPFGQYGKLYIILSVCILGLSSPIEDLIYVRFPEIMIDLLSARKPLFYIGMIAALICGISFLNNAIVKIARAYFTRKQVEIELKLKQNIYEKAMQLDYKYIDSPKYYNSYAWVLKEYAEQVDQGRQLIVNFFQCFLSLIALSAVIASFGPWILLIEVVQMALHAIINKRVNINIIKQKESTVPLDRRLDYFHRLFYMKDHAADMKSTPLSESIFNRYSETGKQKIEVVSSFAVKAELWNCTHEIVFCLTEFIIVLYLAKSIVSGKIPEVGMYMTLLLSFYRLDSKIDVLTYIMKDASSLSMNVEKIRNFFQIQSEIEVDKKNIGAIPDDNIFSVEFKDVGFSYENSEFSLSGLNLFIKPGEKIAIVGENGAGKSTFVKLLLRLYDVEKGEIRINGHSIKEYNVHSLRQKIGVAFQNTNIYAMSFADNISLYGELSDSDLRKVTKLLGLDSVLEKNHTDYDAELTREFHESGVILSGGEAQKIALARVMGGSFGLLLLDEPSSALDPIAEYEISQSILSTANKATTIIIAHRLSMIRDVDRIVVLDHGKICECGNHNALMALQGKYYEMFTKQAMNYVKD